VVLDHGHSHGRPSVTVLHVLHYSRGMPFDLVSTIS
jgi:hypothetical protein